METLLKVGYGRADITPEGSVPMGGYGNPSNRYNEEVRDPLYATCIAFTDCDGNTVLLFTTDAIRVNPVLADEARDILCPELGLERHQIMVGSTHSHSTPETSMKEVPTVAAYRVKYVEGLCEAARMAMADRLPALPYVGFQQTESMNFIRHYKMADGSYAGANFGSFAKGCVGHASTNDPWLQVIKFVRIGGKDVILMNFQAHPCFTGGIDKKVLSADYIGDLRKYMETKTGARFAFFQGAAGNQNGISFYRRETRTYDSAEYGRLLGEYALKALEAPVAVAGGKVEILKRTLTMELDHSDDHKVPMCEDIWAEWKQNYDRPASNKRANEIGLNSIYAVSAVIGRAERDTQEDMDIYAFRVGDLGFACAPYEMFCASGEFIKDWSPYAMTFVVSCCNDARGYLATRLAYSHGSYEVDTRRYPVGCAEYLAENFVDMLKELKEN